MYHDAVHYQISSNKRKNDFIINLLVGVPFLLPIHLYRELHLAHHDEIGTEADPEILLYHRGQQWKYEALPGTTLFVQLLGDLTMWNNFKTIWYYFIEKKKQPPRLKLVKSKVFPEMYIMIVLFIIGIGILYFNFPMIMNKLLLVWLLPFYTFTQLFQKLRSYSEHTFNEEGTYTGSWKPGLIGRLTLWPYNINYHREHHERPNIAWDELPVKYPDADQRSGSELWKHLYHNASKS